MKLIVGLGNPGIKYQNNRHNVGYMVVEKLQNSKTPNTQVVKTNTFMNDSGKFIKRLVSKYPSIPVSNLYIVHDDLDIPIGSFKIQFGKGPKDHKGLNSIYNELGTQDFWHVRVGVDNRDPNGRIEGEEYVLQDFTGEERKVLDRVIKEICKKLATS